MEIDLSTLLFHLYRLMVTSNYNIVFKATLSVITIVTVQTFYKKVWPDIKGEFVVLLRVFFQILP